MTLDEILNFANKQSGSGPVTEARKQELLDLYKPLKRQYIDERDWIFTLSYARQPQIISTSQGRDLGYKYKYVIDVDDIIDVRDINIEQQVPLALQNLASDELIRWGYSRGEDFTIGQPTSAGWEYVDGVLHADCPVTSAIVKIDPVEDNIPSDLAVAIAYYVASAAVLGTLQDYNLYRINKAEAKQAHDRALRDWLRRPSSLNEDVQTIYRWVQSFYANSRSF